MQQKRLRMYMRLAITALVALLLLLMAFQSIWVIGGSASGIMEATGLQRARMQAIAKDALILQYQSPDARPQAISELQNTLPRFEKTQAGLQNGDISLQLPTHVPDDIAPQVLAAQSDYLSIDSALRHILAHTDQPVDPIQVAIILSHEHSYALAMTQIDITWKQHIDSAFLRIFWIESGLVVVIIMLNVIVYFFVSRRIIPDLRQRNDTVPLKEAP